MVSLDDGREHEIQSFSDMAYPALQAWSPDGRWIAACDAVNWTEIWVERDFDERVSEVLSR